MRLRFGASKEAPSNLLAWALAMIALSAFVAAQGLPAIAERGGAVPGPLPVFPPDNWWNQDISGAPVDAGSAQFINFIGATRALHPDFGGYDLENPGSIYGIPYAVVGADQPKQTVEFYYPHESDGVTHPGNVSFPFYPIPEEAKTQSYWIEGGPPGSADPAGDRHMLIVDRDNRHLYELFDLHWAGTRWEAGSGAFFDLNRNDRRPDGWTSADAAGLAIFPGLVRYDEVYGPDEIRHAFRVTVAQTNGYVWPASHVAGSTAGALPMGARLRLKASVNFSNRPPAMQKIFRAMQRYGLIVADNGSNMYITGTFDPRWDNDVLNPAFASLRASDFEVVQLGWRPPASCPPIGAPSNVIASVSGFRVTLSWAPPTSGSVGAYVVEAGTQPGASNLGSFTLPATQTSIEADAPAGQYHIRLRARSACGLSAPSSDAHAIVPSSCTVPSAPGQFTSSVAGSLVSLMWSAVAGANRYVLEVGSSSGASDLLRVAVGGTAITGAAPPALYYARVRGQSACGEGPPSQERVISVIGCAPPTPAGPLTSSVDNGNMVTLQWPPMPGAAAYRIEVGNATGASNLLVTNVNTNVVSSPAPPGVYHVRVRGLSACGAGAATNEIAVHVP